MSKTLKNTLLSFVGIIVIAVTLGVYLLLEFTKTPANNIGISFVLFAELALFGFIIGMGFMSKKPNSLFLRAGIISGLSLYFIATVILLIISNIFSDNINDLWIFEIVIFAITLVIVIAIILFSSKINSGDQKILSDRRLIQICEKRISDLLSTNKNSPYEPQLVIILEKLKYCDKIGASTVDEKIVGAIMNLEKELGLAEPNANDIFNDLTALITQRNTEIADSKRGGF